MFPSSTLGYQIVLSLHRSGLGDNIPETLWVLLPSHIRKTSSEAGVRALWFCLAHILQLFLSCRCRGCIVDVVTEAACARASCFLYFDWLRLFIFISCCCE